MLVVISVHLGARTISAYIKDLVARGQDEERQQQVLDILNAWTSGQKAEEAATTNLTVAALQAELAKKEAELDRIKAAVGKGMVAAAFEAGDDDGPT